MRRRQRQQLGDDRGRRRQRQHDGSDVETAGPARRRARPSRAPCRAVARASRSRSCRKPLGVQQGESRGQRHLRGRRFGQGAHRPGEQDRRLRGFGLAVQGHGEATGPDLVLPDPARPDHHLVQPVGRGHAEPEPRHDRRDLRDQDHQVERPCDRGGQSRRSASRTRRSPSPTAPTARAPPRTSPSGSRSLRRTRGR